MKKSIGSTILLFKIKKTVRYQYSYYHKKKSIRDHNMIIEIIKNQ